MELLQLGLIVTGTISVLESLQPLCQAPTTTYVLVLLPSPQTLSQALYSPKAPSQSVPIVKLRDSDSVLPADYSSSGTHHVSRVQIVLQRVPRNKAASNKAAVYIAQQCFS